MSQKVKDEPVGFSSPVSSPISVSHLASSGSPIVITRSTGGTPVSAVRIDSSGRATPVSLIKTTDVRGKAPSFVKIVRPSPTLTATPVVKVESTVKAEPREITAIPKPVQQKFDPSAVAVAVPRKVVPRSTIGATAARHLSTLNRTIPKPEPQSSSTADNDVVHEFIVRAPKLGRRRFSVLRFTGGVDFTKCEKAVMHRENNLREFKSSHDIVDTPKTGAGSEYRREQREEARRKKYGLKALEYNPHDQPWMLQFHPTSVKTEVKAEVKTEVKDEPKSKVDAKSKSETKPDVKEKSEVKRFRGHREGSITDNVTYFVFTQCKDGAFEAFPISAWYKMTAAPPYKHLNTDEAELEFARRGKIRNYMNLMVARRLQEANEEGEEEGRVGASEEKGGSEGKSQTAVVAREALSAVTKAAVVKVDAERTAGKGRKGGAKGKKTGKKKRSLMLTEMDDWLDEDEEDEEDDDVAETKEAQGDMDGDSDSEKPGKDSGKGKRVRRGAGRKQEHSDSEVDDDSEPDDREGEEVDYMTHSSSDEEKLNVDQREAIYEEKGVAEEDALKGLLTDASSDDENAEEEEDEDENKDGSSKRKEGTGDRSERGGGRGNAGRGNNSDDSSSSSSSSDDESDSDLEKEAAKRLSRLTPLTVPAESQSVAAPCTSSSSSSNTGASSSAWAAAVREDDGRKRKCDAVDGTEAKRMRPEGVVTEEAIRRYLLRKPMSAKDLLLKFSRRLPLRAFEISKQIARHLKRMRVQKRNVNGVTLLSLANN